MFRNYDITKTNFVFHSGGQNHQPQDQRVHQQAAHLQLPRAALRRRRHHGHRTC